MVDLISMGEKAREASYVLANVSTEKKDEALRKIADLIVARDEEILVENAKDLKVAEEKGTPKAMIDRLSLSSDRIKAMAEGAVQVAGLQDPVGEVISMWKRPNGLTIGQQRVPMGVVGIIYESRPNVTLDAAALCLKSGNATILRGGKDAINSNIAIIKVIQDALEEVGLPRECVQLIEDTNRETATKMMKLNGYIDVLIPRGGAGLIQSVVQNATVPVIETGTGNCHVYVDEFADLEMAKNIVVNAKTSRPGVCNACETVLIHEAVAEEFLPILYKELKERNTIIRGCEKTQKIIDSVEKASEEDWGTEYLDYIIAAKVVSNIDEAIAHINKYNTKHSEAIVTKDYTNSQKFLQRVDAAAVYVNASTRFTDGFEFGFGAEIGISTQKLHARGPMGLKELTTIKYIIYGNGQIR